MYNNPNAHIPTFCKRWSFIWRCFFPASILKKHLQHPVKLSNTLVKQQSYGTTEQRIADRALTKQRITPNIVRLTIWHQLILELWLVDTWFFAHTRNQHNVTRLENVRQLNIRRGKKLGFQSSPRQPPRSTTKEHRSPLSTTEQDCLSTDTSDSRCW